MHSFAKRGAAALAALALGCALCACGGGAASAAGGDFTSVPAADTAGASGAAGAAGASGTTGQTAAGTAGLVYRAMWFSYLEWSHFDTASADAFRQSVGAAFDNCADLGLNCVVVQVRPFSDAIYPSSIYPWSHIVTGTQGQDPGYDPLAILIEEAHSRGLAFEAWVNPYRVRASDTLPAGELAASNPAVTHPDWAIAANNGLYFDPSNADVQKMIVDGVVEILQKYDVEGVEFDDYFYPTTDPSFDAAQYAAKGGGQELAVWRRSNVDALVQAVHAAVQQTKPGTVFGISPQGNNEQNYDAQYSDVPRWLSTAGYADYIMPQTYWGYGYTLQNGKTDFAFETLIPAWAALPRADGVSLTFGLGAYRIGEGDGGTNDQSQWQSGHNLADMVQTLAATPGVRGFALYRYDSLFHNDAYPDLCAAEVQALRAVLRE